MNTNVIDSATAQACFRAPSGEVQRRTQIRQELVTIRVNTERLWFSGRLLPAPLLAIPPRSQALRRLRAAPPGAAVVGSPGDF